jgi:glycine dehydrogenase subunit 2
MIIAIDGPAASGKGTIAKQLAAVYGLHHLDTGLIYRAVAKAVLDYGMHAPTVYFPLIVHEALMIEPTESEPLEVLDEYAAALNEIYAGMKEGTLGAVPKNTSVGKVDEVKASHPLTLRVHW